MSFGDFMDTEVRNIMVWYELMIQKKQQEKSDIDSHKIKK